MRRTADAPLGPLTTLGVGGRADQLVRADTDAELVGIVRDLDRAGETVLVLGGGSNVLISDEGLDGTAVLVRTRGSERSDACGISQFTFAAGEVWDDLVATMVADGYSGIEALSGIPGLVGATPIQNVGAYGQEVAQSLIRVRVWDRSESRARDLMAQDCRLAYRDSRFKADPDGFVILSVTLGLERSRAGAPIRYGELARVLGVGIGDRAASTDVRSAVLELRAGKGMVLEASDPDTASAGSFFTNPILPPERADALPADAPAFAVPGGVKVSAAWLIQSAGFDRGYTMGPARLSTKHTLALTNTGGARARDLLALARHIRDGVERAHGILLAPEPVLVGCDL